MRKTLILVILLPGLGLASGFSFRAEQAPYHLEVIDLRGADEQTRLLALSLQGIVNRGSPRIYVLWESRDRFANPSEEWLRYYRSKGWITYSSITLEAALRKYAPEVEGFIIYDPHFRHSINIATTMAGLYDALIAHPDLVPWLSALGFSLVEDLRGRWRDKYEAYEWQLTHLFPQANKELIASAMPVEDLWTHRPIVKAQRPIRDYVIMHRAAALDLISSSRFPRDVALLERYYARMNPYARVLGYPASGVLERPHVELASKHGLVTVLAAATAVNFSVHSQMPAETTYRQDHCSSFRGEPDKIYLAFAMSDLGLNTMQDRSYGAWDDPRRGELPVSWWLDGIVRDFAPGIVQYYYETKTPNDYFYGAHVGGRIRPSDFLDLMGYLERGERYLEACDLVTVAFSNHGRWDERVFETYSRALDRVIGFFYGWMPEWELGEELAGRYWIQNGKAWLVTAVGATADVAGTVGKISEFIERHEERPLFITVLVVLGNYPDFEFLAGVRRRVDSLYPGETIWVRVDELIRAILAWEATGDD